MNQVITFDDAVRARDAARQRAEEAQRAVQDAPLERKQVAMLAWMAAQREHNEALKVVNHWLTPNKPAAPVLIVGFLTV